MSFVRLGAAGDFRFPLDRISDLPTREALAELGFTLNAMRLEVEKQAFKAGPYANIFNTSFSLSDDTSTAILFDAETEDDTGMHDLSANTDRVTILENDLYLAVGQVSFPASAVGSREVALTVNGAGQQTARTAPAATLTTNLVVVAPVRLVETDIVRLTALQNSGGPLSVAARLYVVGIG